MTRCKSPLVLRVDVGTNVTWRRGGDIGPAPNRLLFPGRRKRPRGVPDSRGREASTMATQTKRRRVSRGGPERGPPLSAAPRPYPARSVVPRLSFARTGPWPPPRPLPHPEPFLRARLRLLPRPARSLGRAFSTELARSRWRGLWAVATRPRTRWPVS